MINTIIYDQFAVTRTGDESGIAEEIEEIEECYEQYNKMDIDKLNLKIFSNKSVVMRCKLPFIEFDFSILK